MWQGKCKLEVEVKVATWCVKCKLAREVLNNIVRRGPSYRYPKAVSGLTMNVDDQNQPLLGTRDESADEECSLDAFLTSRDPDIAFGGPQQRLTLEKRLLKKLDRRMSILILIYILNCRSSLESLCLV